ncbi:MAG: M13 family peptidase, partial [Sphingobacteriales bacterium]
LVRVAAELHNKGINVLFADAVGQDDKNSTKMMYWIWQGGLLLPDRDYYFNTDAATVGTRGAFKEYIAKTLRRLDPGNANVDKRADAVFELEKKLAGKSRKLGDLRDPEANYHKMDIKQLQALAPKINWSLYTKGIGIANLDSLIVGQPEFLSSLSEQVIATSLDTWKDYLRVQVIHAMAPYLDSSTYRDYFTYRSKLYGVPKQRPRWKRVLQAQANAMGEAVGELFVKDYFNERTKDRYVKMVEAVRSAFQNRIEHLSWMSDTTKQKALMKLSSMTYKVGYPDKWKDFSALKIDRESYVLNVQRANTWWHQREINKLGRPVDKTEWKMTPQTYDAYYSPSNNEILLPAAIFIVPGKKDEELDDAFVYGNAAAATIGH